MSTLLPTATDQQTVPSVSDVEKIAAIADPVLRNLLITQTYCELSQAFAQRTGVTANWCTFATWASKQAGQTIRGEDLQRALQALLKNEPGLAQALTLLILLAKQLGAKGSPEQLQHAVILRLLESVAQRAGDAVARGNRKVFEEIARHFARFMTLCYTDESFSEDHLHRLLDELKDGPPPGGQQYLKQAFTRYYRALFENDAQTRTELCLLANLEIGFHEQTRLQPEIAEALNAAFIDRAETKAILHDNLFAEMSLWGRLKLWVQRLFGKTSLLSKAMDAYAVQEQDEVRKLLTHHLMTLTLPPANRLQLGRDLAATFPDNLRQLHNADLLLLLKEVDPTPDSLVQSGATDWALLPERLHYIADLFRCYHCTADLFSNAFTPEQVSAMKAGRVPEGEL